MPRSLPVMAFSLLLLAIVSISVVVAQTPPTCPAAPIWPITPAWASFTGDYTGYGDANNFGPAPLSDLTAVKAAVVDSTSPYAKAHGTQIYLSGVLNAVPTVVRVQGGDSFGPDSTNAAFTANWTGTQLRCLTVDQQTGEVYGLTDAYDIVHLVSDGTLATILTPETFSRLYLNLNDTATIPRIYTPVAIAIDASSNLFIAVDSYQKNPMISVLQPPANGQNATLTKITGSDYYNIGPYSRTYDPYYGATPSSLQFAHGYLHFFEYENGVVVRTQFPYSTFGSAADFDQNRLVVETPSNYDKNFAAAVIHDGTGTMFAITNEQSLVQITAVGGIPQLSPSESPCLADTIQLLGLPSSLSSFLAIDDSAHPTRLYTMTLNNRLSWWNVTLKPDLPASAAGCLTPAEQSSFTEAVPLPTYQAPAALLDQPNAKPFGFAGLALGINVRAFGAGVDGIAYIGGVVTGSSPEVPIVVKIRPGNSIDGSDLVPLSNWTLPTGNLPSKIVYRAQDAQLFVLAGDRIWVMNSSSTEAFAYTDIYVLKSFTLDPQGRIFGASAGGVVVFETDPVTGAGGFTLMQAGARYADGAYAELVTYGFLDIQFANGHLYLVNSGYTAIIRTLNPYCYHNASDFLTNPLISVIQADWEAKFQGFVIEPQTGALIVDVWSRWEQSGKVSVFTQYQQVGSGNHIQAGWRYPCLANTLAQPFAKRAPSVDAPTFLSLDLAANPPRVYSFGGSGNVLFYVTVPSFQPALPQSALSCVQAPGGVLPGGVSSSGPGSSSGPASSSSGPASSSSTGPGMDPSSASIHDPMAAIVALAVAAVVTMRRAMF